jgi:transposase
VIQHKPGRKIVGVDLGDRDSFICMIDDANGEVLERTTIPTSSSAFEEYFARHEPMLVALETGTHSPWASRVVTNAGHEVIVANARQVPLIFNTKHKSDMRDGEKLARMSLLAWSMDADQQVASLRANVEVRFSFSLLGRVDDDGDMSANLDLVAEDRSGQRGDRGRRHSRSGPV